MKRSLKIAAIAVGAVVVILAGGFTTAHLRAEARLAQRFETHHTEFSVPAPSDSAAIARGKHLAEARYACTTCHGEDLAGGVMIDDPAIGLVRAPNLTKGKGGRTANYTVSDWDRVVRHGVKRDGTPTIMPSDDFFQMSDSELGDIVAFARSLAPVDVETTPPSFGPIGKVLLATGKFPLAAERHPDHGAAHAAVPPAADDAKKFGAHLAATCMGCHGPRLAGGPMPFGPPDWPPAANLTPHAAGLAAWSYEDFEKALTSGVSRDGEALKEPMAGVVAGTKQMLPDERQALWTYLRSLPAADGGS